MMIARLCPVTGMYEYTPATNKKMEFETILDIFKDYYEKTQEKNNAAANQEKAQNKGSKDENSL